MPHLQDKEVDTKSGHSANGGASTSSSDIPIREAREGYLNGTEGLQTIMVTSSKILSSPVKVESYKSSEEAAHGTTTDYVSATPLANATKHSVITPSPFGHRGVRNGPVVTIYGNKRLVPSPIRVKRRVSNSEDEESDAAHMDMSMPTNLRYVNTYVTPSKGSPAEVCESSDEDVPKKRLLGQLEGEQSAAKRLKTRRADSPEYVSSATVNDDGPQTSPVPRTTPKKKKPLITPTSSNEKMEDDESTGTAPRAPGYPPYEYRGYLRPPFPHPAFAGHPAYGAHPHPHYSGYPMYNGYPPPPPPAHMMNGPPVAPFYPPYPPHHPAMMRQFPGRPMPQNKFPSPYPQSPARMMQKSPVPPTELSKGGLQEASGPIKSVAEWQRAALSTGKPPSANRCVQLKEPIPSKYWGNAEKTKDVALPDFHRLVNYPDYLTKSRSSSTSETSGTTPSGKKNCVMCGKFRVCSATSLVGKGRGAVPKTEDASSMQGADEDDDGTAHIIPRQNKGLCTACDVAVWVVVADGLEIKWCKGCKNFRPWAAFGDKGSATKCTRCRDRQREKYALQKDEIRMRRCKRSGSGSPEGVGPADNVSSEEDNHLAAARGLRNLMNAATV